MNHKDQVINFQDYHFESISPLFVRQASNVQLFTNKTPFNFISGIPAQRVSSSISDFSPFAQLKSTAVSNL